MNEKILNNLTFYSYYDFYYANDFKIKKIKTRNKKA